MFQTQNRGTKNSTWKVAVSFQDHYDDERNNTVFHNTTSDMQDQDRFILVWDRCPETDAV